MKKLFLSLILSMGVLPLSAARVAQQPEFDNGSIMMSANGGLCGGFTIEPLRSEDTIPAVRVVAQRFAESLFGSSMRPGKPLSNWVELTAGGIRVGYDWAGPRPSYHYRIFCERKNEHGAWIPVDCQKVVIIRDTLHNRPCVWGPAGAQAQYEPLNMRVSGTN